MLAPKLSSEIINQFMKNVDESLRRLPVLTNQCQLSVKVERSRFLEVNFDEGQVHSFNQ